MKKQDEKRVIIGELGVSLSKVHTQLSKLMKFRILGLTGFFLLVLQGVALGGGNVLYSDNDGLAILAARCTNANATKGLRQVVAIQPPVFRKDIYLPVYTGQIESFSTQEMAYASYAIQIASNAGFYCQVDTQTKDIKLLGQDKKSPQIILSFLSPGVLGQTCNSDAKKEVLIRRARFGVREKDYRMKFHFLTCEEENEKYGYSVLWKYYTGKRFRP